MSEYELRFSRVQDNRLDRVSFLAEDTASALIMAHDRASNRCAELWRDGVKLCTIRRVPVADDHYWQIAS